MKAKQKAKQLIEKFRPYVDTEIAGENNFEYSKQQETIMAAKCALIAVSECIQTLIDYGTDNDELQNMDSDFRFWDEVQKKLVTTIN